MANQYSLTNDFAAIAEESGTLYNKGDSAIELASTADTAKGQGIILLTGERRTFNGTLYARSMDETGLLNVADFNDGGEGGESYLTYKGSVATYTDLPTSPKVGDVYNIQSADEDHGILAGDNVAWNGTDWDRLAGVYAVMTGATASKNGKAGLVPAPTAGQEKRVLTGAGAWEMPYGMRQNSTAYAVGDIAFSASLPSGLVLKCTTGGTTAATEPTFSGATVGDTVTDGTVTWRISYHDTDYNGIVDAQINPAAAHNGLYRGKDLTDYFASGKMSEKIADGSFEDIYIGDYITKGITVNGTAYNNLKWLVAGLDSHLHSGSVGTTAHHVVLITENVPGVNIRMNATNTTEGGFVGSEMWTTTLPKWATGIKNAFGTAHVLNHKELLTKAVSATAATGNGGLVGSANSWDWYDVEVNIPNEPMVYGGKVFGGGYDVGDWPRQLPLFALMGIHQTTRQWYWLRAVASASYFARADSYGPAYLYSASTSYAGGGLRPYFLLR